MEVGAGAAVLVTVAVAVQAQRSKHNWLHPLTLLGALECAGYLTRTAVAALIPTHAALTCIIALLVVRNIY